MKKIFILCLLSIAVFSSGCVKYSCNITLDNKDNITLEEINAVNLPMIASFDEDATEQLAKEFKSTKQVLEKRGYKVESYRSEGLNGYKSSKTCNIQKLSKDDLPLGYSTTQKTLVEKKRSFFKDTYTIDLIYNMQAANGVLPSNAIEALGRVPRDKRPIAELKIKTPAPAKVHNSTDFDSYEKTYSWTLISKTPVEIKLQYELINWFNVALAVLSAILALFLLIAIKDKSSANDFKQHL